MFLWCEGPAKAFLPLAGVDSQGVDLSLNVIAMPAELLLGHEPAGVSGRGIDIAVE
jgi:hypothetical protein